MDTSPQEHIARGRKAVSVLCWVSLLLGGIFVTWTAIERRERPWDDELITLTYAKNIAAGHGFVYNQPPATLGTTTPLVAIVIGLLGWLFPRVDLVYMAVSLSSTCCVGVGWLIFLNHNVLRLRDYEAALLALVFFIFTRHAMYFNVGIEYPPFLFLLVSATLLYLHGRLLACGVVTGLLFLVRGEGALLLPVLGLAHVMRTGPGLAMWRLRHWWPTARAAWRGGMVMGLGFALVIGLWTAYALPTFGTVLPNTLRAKMLQRETFAPDTPDFWTCLVADMPQWAESANTPIHAWWIHLLAVLGLLSLAVLRSPLLILVSWGLVYTVAYSILALPGVYNWYQIPVFYTWLIGLGAGLILVVRGVLSVRRVPQSLRIAITSGLVLATMAPVAYQHLRSARTNGGDPRAEGYGAIAQWLRENADPKASVAVGEVGFIGYYTDNKILDLAGLVSPEILEMLASPEKPDVLTTLMPDYYVQVTHRANAFHRGSMTIGENVYRPVLQVPLHTPWPNVDSTAALFKNEGPPKRHFKPVRRRSEPAVPTP